MTQGRALREKSDFSGALELFRAADAIMGVPTTGYELAKAQADVGQLVEARATVRSLLAAPRQANEPEPFTEARRRAEELDAALDKRIGALRFVITGAAPSESLRITVDGEEVPAPALRLPFRVNPGHHRVVAEAHQQRVEREIDARERDTVDVPLPLPVGVGAAPSAAPTTAGANGLPAHTEPRIPALAYVGGGIAAAGLVVGSVTGLLASSKAHDAKAGCVDVRCPPSTWSNLDSARALATASTIGFAVAGAGLATGIIALLLAKPSAEPASQARLVVSTGLSNVTISGSF